MTLTSRVSRAPPVHTFSTFLNLHGTHKNISRIMKRLGILSLSPTLETLIMVLITSKDVMRMEMFSPLQKLVS